MVNGPLIRPNLLGVNVALGGGALNAHDPTQGWISIRDPSIAVSPGRSSRTSAGWMPSPQ